MSKALSVGFDYGTSHCSIGVLSGHNSDQVDLIPLSQSSAIVPSTLFTMDRNLIYRFVAEHIQDDQCKNQYVAERLRQLMRAKLIEEELGLSKEAVVLFGDEAFEEYTADPSEGHYVRSPKSFLGSSGLSDAHLEFIEQIVAAMMIRFKTQAEAHCQTEITNAVIGRPINFQGLRGEESNRQAIAILHRAASTAGFKQVEFLYEPLAAGIDFETSLVEDKVVLVVDIGGGTTDCSIIRMGPNHIHQTDRATDFLAHSGRRIGGNDFDIVLAYQMLMPLFGSQTQLKSGKPMPTQPFWHAVEINNAGAQAEFYDAACGELLERLMLETLAPQSLARLIRLRHEKQNFQLVASAEKAKLALSDHAEVAVDISYVEANLGRTLLQSALAEVFRDHIQSVLSLIDEALAQAECSPDCVYVTGGMGKSPLLHQAIQNHVGEIEVLSGDYFGSVTAGLAKWAGRLFG